jgi:glyoxylase-like metal-dependent hydrolase (beta-lactamase superfamily II)
MGAGARIRVGAHAVEIVADGVAAYSVSDVFPDVEPTLLRSVLEGRLNADGSLPLPYDPLLVRTADGPILVDGGAGEELAAEWGEPVGRTQASLAAAGVAPEEIVMVLITHAHGDHVAELPRCQQTPVRQGDRQAPRAWLSREGHQEHRREPPMLCRRGCRSRRRARPWTAVIAGSHAH